MWRFILASSLGTFLEFFDLALYSFAATSIAQNFFSAGDPTVAVLATWTIFAVSYLLRPLSAIWFGHLSDTHGAKRTMVISMSMMAVATTCIGLLPGYEQIGLWAPILLLFLRMMQSVAVSPEYNLPSVFIKNNNWCQQRFGLVSSISAFVTGLGTMSASWVLARYEWRLPFIVAGILVGTIGIYLRWNLDESLAVKPPKIVPLKLVFSQQRKDFIQAVIVAGYVGCMSYALFSFLVHQLKVVKLMAPSDALKVLSQGSLLPAIFALIAGYLSDKVSRNILMLSAALVMGGSGYYLFNYLAIAEHSLIIMLTSLMLASLGFFAGSFPGYLADLFKQEYRYTGTFLAYNLGMSWIGGMSPLVFINLTGYSAQLPAILIAGYSALIVGLVAKPIVSVRLRELRV